MLYVPEMGKWESWVSVRRIEEYIANGLEVGSAAILEFGKRDRAIRYYVLELYMSAM